MMKKCDNPWLTKGLIAIFVSIAGGLYGFLLGGFTLSWKANKCTSHEKNVNAGSFVFVSQQEPLQNDSACFDGDSASLAHFPLHGVVGSPQYACAIAEAVMGGRVFSHRKRPYKVMSSKNGCWMVEARGTRSTDDVLYVMIRKDDGAVRMFVREK